MDSRELALGAAEAADEHKAKDIVILDVANITLVADYFLICGATTSVQVRAIGDHVEERLSRLGRPLRHREGYRTGTWLLLDFGAVIVHVFRDEERRFYNLERLWGDATPVPGPAGAPPEPRPRLDSRVQVSYNDSQVHRDTGDDGEQ